MKYKIIVVNPVSTNIMKAICNSLIANLVDIIIIGNREKIQKLCDRVNINICILRIIHCNNEKEIVFKLKQYQEKAKVDGIIIDELKEYKYKELLNCDYLCHMIDFNVFKKSVCLLHEGNKINLNNQLLSIIALLNKLNIRNIKIGIVSQEQDKALNIRNNIKKNMKINNVEIINYELIEKCNYNIIIFANKQLKLSFISRIEEYTLPKVVEINKASNILIFNASGKSLKNIFFEFLFLSKINQLNYEFNTQAI